MRNRISRNAGTAAAAELVVTALLTSGAVVAAARSPINHVVLVNCEPEHVSCKCSAPQRSSTR